MADWKGPKQTKDYDSKAVWKGAPCNEDGRKEKKDLSPGMSEVKPVSRMKSQKMGK